MRKATRGEHGAENPADSGSGSEGAAEVEPRPKAKVPPWLAFAIAALFVTLLLVLTFTRRL